MEFWKFINIFTGYNFGSCEAINDCNEGRESFEGIIHKLKTTTTTALLLNNKRLARKNLSVESVQNLGRPYLTHLST